MRHHHDLQHHLGALVLAAGLAGCAIAPPAPPTPPTPVPAPSVAAPVATPASVPPPIAAAPRTLPQGAAASGACPADPVPAARYPQRTGRLTGQELAMARTAWSYFERNTQPTGLANSVDGFPSTTMWDTSAQLAALVAASELGLAPASEVDSRLARLVDTLGRLSLFRDEMPNKVYNTQTLAKANYANQPGEIGFSALDIGRLLTWLRIVKERYPQHADAIDRAVLRWKFDRVVTPEGDLKGATVDSRGRTSYLQEGRLGYEEYAARGFELWGFRPASAARAEPMATTLIHCVPVPHDGRDPRRWQQNDYVVAESYVLDGLEFNWDQTLDRDSDDRRHTHPFLAGFAHRVYQAQENRFHATGILTARSEHQLDDEPHFVYDTVYSNGIPWNTITDRGQAVPQFAAVSTKAAIGMWVLWHSPYTDRLLASVAPLRDPGKGFQEGLLENGRGPIRALTANNNGIILEALLYKAQGKLLKWGPPREGLWERSRR